MGRNQFENTVDQRDVGLINQALAQRVLQVAINHGVREFCVCPGSRNSPFVNLLINNPFLTLYYWFEERSAAFFALGRIKRTKRPIAVITTSGTAAGELLPAAMEAYYVGIPLMLITADRPRHFRWTGAPQSAEQVGIFGVYTSFDADLENDETLELSRWDQKGPAHLNVCFDEPLLSKSTEFLALELPNQDSKFQLSISHSHHKLHEFLSNVTRPLAIVSTLKEEDRQAVVRFLCHLKIPVIIEAVSGLRGHASLRHLEITRTERIWTNASQADYAIDGVLRIGGVPTVRLWRDLEDKKNELSMCSINDVPFSGLSWGNHICAPLAQFFNDFVLPNHLSIASATSWLIADHAYRQKLNLLLEEFPLSESSLIYSLSQKISPNSFVFLGNSLPIREWDLTANDTTQSFEIMANRGLNGIDGQISTFLGLARNDVDNWALLGDLTTLYDMAGPWILEQLKDIKVNLVVINNGGGMIFSRMYSGKEFLNCHQLSFEPLARMWNLPYQSWHTIPEDVASETSQLIELVPDADQTAQFWERLAQI